jgi:hypothetical protein
MRITWEYHPLWGFHDEPTGREEKWYDSDIVMMRNHVNWDFLWKMLWEYVHTYLCCWFIWDMNSVPWSFVGYYVPILYT